MTRHFVVTGGLGFIGSALVRRLMAAGNDVSIVDHDTYAGDLRRFGDATDLRVELCDVAESRFADFIATEKPDVIVHLAAETHVTRGERDLERFTRTNVGGTSRVVEAAERAGVGLTVHVSTDEVYGPSEGRAFTEEEKEAGEGRATSIYARTKALADDIARSASARIPIIVVRPTNCLGPWQHPEKAVPRWSIRALRNERIPVWGDGGQVRDWMFVDDACGGIETVVERGVPGEVYNIGPEHPRVSNLEVARMIAQAAGRPQDAVYLTAYDRPDHDRCYAVDSTKLRRLGWSPLFDLNQAIDATVAWYRTNEAWWRPLVEEAEALYHDALARDGSL